LIVFVLFIRFINLNDTNMITNVFKILMSIFLILSTMLTMWKMIMRMTGNLLLIVKRWMGQLGLLIKT